MDMIHNQDTFPFYRAESVQRLSIKNASFVDADYKESQPISQEMLVKMVRRHRKLRWLRSDLTPVNIAMLQSERRK
jgi:hypothetical protein